MSLETIEVKTALTPNGCLRVERSECADMARDRLITAMDLAALMRLAHEDSLNSERVMGFSGARLMQLLEGLIEEGVLLIDKGDEAD